jgi:hypothetical protein
MAGASAEATAPAWPGRSDGDAARVRSRIADRLVASLDLSPASVPPGVTPDLSGLCVSVDAAGLSAAPLAVRVPFAGRGWLARHRETRWAGAAAELVYELAADALPARSLRKGTER